MRIPAESSLRLKLMSLVALSVVPAICVIVYLGAELHVEAEKQARHNAEHLLKDILIRQETIVANSRQIMETLHKVPAVQQENIAEIESIFRDIQREYPVFLNLFLADLEGLMIASAVPHAAPINVADRKYFRDAVRTGRFSAGEYAVARVIPQPALHFSLPVKGGNGEIRSVLGVAMNLRTFAGLFETAGLPAGSTMTFTDWKGTILFGYPATGRFQGQSDIIWETTHETAASGNTFVEKGLDGVRRVFTSKSLRLSPGDPPYIYVRVGIPEDLAFAQVRRTQHRSLLLVGAALALALTVAWIWGNFRISGPITRVVTAARAIASGKLETRLSEIPSDTETGMLARALNDMAEALEVRHLEHQTAAAEIQKSLNEKEALLREVHHRVKNNLQAIIALIEMQSSSSAGLSLPQAMNDLKGRVRAMAMVHQALYESTSFEEIRIQNYIQDLSGRILEAFSAEDDISLSIDAGDMTLKIDTAIACGLIVNELVTNTVKHAFPPDTGQERVSRNLSIVMRQDGSRCVLTVRDNGRGFPEGAGPAKGGTLGLYLVSMLARSQLAGDLSLRSDDGAVVEISFPHPDTSSCGVNSCNSTSGSC